jgi:hypothetical protein
MRAGLLIAALPALVLLASCGEAGSPVASEANASASEAAPLMGAFRAQSASAHSIVGDLSIERAGLIFTNGVTLYTRALNPRRADEIIARGGLTYAAAALGPSSVVVELRRVTDQVISPTGGARRGACENGEPPRYVAIVYEPPGRTVTILVFGGEDPPGPSAVDSRVCAAYGYTAPTGVRTSAGIVL